MHFLHSSIERACIVHLQQFAIFKTSAGNDLRTRQVTEVNIVAQALRINATQNGFLDGLRAYFQNIQAETARRRVYRKTVRELNALTAQELADLGIHRSMIRSLAMETAYGA